ncbi:MAG: carboxypeptidase regulatory-like domain-containing protein [Fuerstiella sp.]|nr:carboxypeptidase regulatory-like domain-containing protein [Fuerstiella sp.]MCP4858311.1 carboxypeptidase regulatory-like domain-containing protein [Fuerstiella sp.]
MKYIILGMATVLSISGCGGGSDLPELGTVQGKVTVGGQPLATATVSFSPVTEGRPSSGVTDKNGEYSLLYTVDIQGALIGQHRVTIQENATEEESYEEGASESETGKSPASSSDESLMFEVQAGSNVANFEL